MFYMRWGLILRGSRQCCYRSKCAHKLYWNFEINLDNKCKNIKVEIEILVWFDKWLNLMSELRVRLRWSFSFISRTVLAYKWYEHILSLLNKHGCINWYTADSSQYIYAFIVTLKAIQLYTVHCRIKFPILCMYVHV